MFQRRRPANCDTTGNFILHHAVMAVPERISIHVTPCATNMNSEDRGKYLRHSESIVEFMPN